MFERLATALLRPWNKWAKNGPKEVTEIVVNNVSGKTLFRYYFDGRGKLIRPYLTGAMAAAVNCQLQVTPTAHLLTQQQQV